MFTTLRRLSKVTPVARSLSTLFTSAPMSVQKGSFLKNLQNSHIYKIRFQSDVSAEDQMTIQDHLLQMEKEVELLFRRLAEKARTPGIKKILTGLAEDEVKIYQFIENLHITSENIPYLHENQGQLVKELEEVFGAMSMKGLDNDDRDEIHVYQRARDAKGKLRDIYCLKAEKCPDPKGKTILNLAARQAEKHHEILDETVEYLAKAEPGTGAWAVCSEFSIVSNSQFATPLDSY